MPQYVVWTQSRPNRPIFIVWLAITVGINMLALIVVDAMFSGVTIGHWGPLIVGAFVLTWASLGWTETTEPAPRSPRDEDPPVS